MVWIEARVGVAEIGDEAERNNVVLAAINPSPAIFFRGQRPAHGVDDFTGRDASGRDFPEFLYAHAVGLRIAIFIKTEFFDQLLGE